MQLDLRKKLYLLLCSVLLGGPALPVSAQLLTQGGYTAQDLVENVLLGGGVQVSNMSFTGSSGAIGTFDGSNTNIGLNSGVIMTTGSISGPDGPQGPNNKPYAGFDNGMPGSALLNPLVSPKLTYNAATLTFNFIPQGDSVAFRYVFGSEEYKEYVGSEFNDVFGFFITGPNPGGGNYNNTNIAKLPNSNTTVTINNVNHLLNTAYYVDNESPPGQTIQYDGFTRVLTATAKVVPCSTYTIVITIADVSDGIYDSGVFLEAKSFSSQGVDIDYTVINTIAQDTLFETCGDAIVTFTRNSTDVSGPYVVNYQVSGSATNGVDYDLIPTSVTIPAGQMTASITFKGIMDGIAEGNETIKIQIIDTTVCPGVDLPFVEIVLVDVPPLTVTAMPDETYPCNNQVVALSANVSGGIGNLTFQWDNGVGSGNPAYVIVRQPTTFTVTVKDECGNITATDQVTITVPNVPPLSLQFSPDTAICPGETVVLDASAIGGIGDLEYSWSTGAGNVNQQIVAPYNTTVFSVIVKDSCGNTEAASSTITVLAPSADFDYVYIENNLLKFTSYVSSDVDTWNWDFGDATTSSLEHPQHEYRDTGYYDVMLVVTNIFGCMDTVIKPVYAYPPYTFFIPNAFTPNLNGLNDVFSGKGVGFTKYRMQIYDRWGQVVFDTDNYKRGWPGTDKNGNKCPLGVYVYRVDISTPAGDDYQYIGRVNLIR